MLTLVPGKTGLAALEAVYRGAGPVRLDPGARPAVEASARIVAEAVAGGAAVYGVNTGFGKLASHKIPAKDLALLQKNLVLSHSSGIGDPADPAVVRLMLALKLLSLGRGASGVRWEVIALIEAMLAAGLLPVIPSQGSVGASGDLAPLAHMAAVLIGEGEATLGDRRLPGAEALAAAGLAPVALGPKEGLALINGTQFSTAAALAGLFAAWRNLCASLVTGALSTDAVMGSTAPLRAEIHALRGQPGQIAVAAAIRELIEGSEIRESHRDGDTRVQDPYCIRCQPQVAGACLDLLQTAARTLEIEANAVTDNPLVVAGGDILSGGNFHAEPVAFAADQIALAVAEIGAIAQRRVALMVDPTLSFDLPPFLTPDPGLNSGFMIAEVTSAALMSENKHLAHPCSTDSTPTSANQEDHVSMAAHGAVRLARMNRNLSGILGVELLAACQGVGFRAPLLTSAPLQRVLSRVRANVPPVTDDRALAPDLDCAAAMVAAGEIADAAGLGLTLDGPGVSVVEVSRGDGPVVLGLPHTGTDVPEAIRARLNATGRALADTDWHVDRLYAGLLPGATTVRATHHRYVIDVNRSPGGESLYPGQNTTGLCPLTDFDGRPIYADGHAPGADEIAARVATYHAPYHAALGAELDRVRARHGLAVLYDCHSIRSRVPFLFEGELPVLNLGTHDGAAAAPELEATAWEIARTGRFSAVLNGRFKGGWTTRHYGRPETGVHALQMEIAQRAYLAAEAPPWAFDDARAARLRAVLGALLGALETRAKEMTR